MREVTGDCVTGRTANFYGIFLAFQQKKSLRSEPSRLRKHQFLSFKFLVGYLNVVTFRKEMKQAETIIRAANARLCPSVIQPVKCK